MSILIRGMEMPKSCDSCMFSRRSVHNVDWCVLTEKDLPCDCPLIEINFDALVKHGKWIDIKDPVYCIECSVCGDANYMHSNYCPNCGARMDGEA